MAKVGTRAMTHNKRIAVRPSELPLRWDATTYVNLVVSPVQIHATSTLSVAGLGIGMPIMREGFITDTDFLPTAD
jgi:hypothetical protein